MGFQSFTFLWFLIVVFLAFYLTPGRYKWVPLLGASVYFYFSFVPAHLVAVLALVLVNFLAALWTTRLNPGSLKAAVLVMAVIVNVLVLLLFKYLGFLLLNVDRLVSLTGWNYPVPVLQFMVPVGLSFLVFQMIAYITEVKRGRVEAERNPGIFMLYALWFPRVMSGPIERPGDLLPQFRIMKNADSEQLTIGFRQILWGFFQKLVIADRLAVITAPVFDAPGSYTGLSVLFAVILFSFQIYADFAGYTDIALGVSRLFGVRLSPNFRGPYFARSVQEFWTRWHITLSTWLRDYLFLPISYAVSRKLFKDRYLGIRVEVWIYGLASLVTMVICGFWHGAAWTFISWGLLHGVYLLLGFILRPWKRKVNKTLGWRKDSLLRYLWDTAITFSLVSLAWIFFRSGDMASAMTQINNIFIIDDWLNTGLVNDMFHFKTSLILVLIWLLWESYYRKEGVLQGFSLSSRILRWGVYVIIFWAILVFGEFGNDRFIYLQF